MSKLASRGAVAAILVAGCLMTLAYGLHGDVRYEIGTKAVSVSGPVETFTHRPLFYRLVMSAIVVPADLVRRGIPSFELVMRLESVAVCGAASAMLWAGLRRRHPAVALPVAVSAFGATVLMSPGLTFEPEWMSTVLVIAGVGAGVAFQRVWPSALLGGLLLAAAAAVKVVTLPIALIGVVALLVLDRQRAWRVIVAAAAIGLAYLGAVALWAPHEIVWLRDMQTVQPLPRPLPVQMAMMGEYAANLAVMWPAVALLPAALVGARPVEKAAVAGAVLLAWLPAQIQQQFFVYHAAALPAVAAVVVVLGLRRIEPPMVVLVVALTGWTAWLLTAPHTWRGDRHQLWLAVTVVIAAVAWWLNRRALRGEIQRGSGATVGLLAAGLVVVTFVPTSTPTAAESVSLTRSERRTPILNAEHRAADIAAGARLRREIGAQTPVTYLAFGDTTYYVRNPTSCRYPSPVFLQRGRLLHTEERTRSWQESLSCLINDPGEWLIWDTTWFETDRVPREVVDAIDAAFDCNRATVEGKLHACPRR